MFPALPALCPGRHCWNFIKIVAAAAQLGHSVVAAAEQRCRYKPMCCHVPHCRVNVPSQVLQDRLGIRARPGINAFGPASMRAARHQARVARHPALAAWHPLRSARHTACAARHQARAARHSARAARHHPARTAQHQASAEWHPSSSRGPASLYARSGIKRAGHGILSRGPA